jgi:outer membrane protein assembly complex protein YaeT
MKNRIVTLILLLMVVGITNSVALGEGNDALIEAVLVQIDGRPGGVDIEMLIAVRPGELFSLNKINYSIKQIYKTGLFADVQVLKRGSDRIELTFMLTSQPVSRSVHFIGVDSVPRRRLENKVYSLRQGSPYTEERLEKAREELTRALLEEGIFDPDIRGYTEKIPQTTQVDVFFDIQSTRTYSVRDIQFSGSVLFPTEKLLQEMDTRGGRRYIPSDLTRDIQRLQELYFAEDYRRAEVRLQKQEFDETNSDVILTLEIIPHERIVVHVTGAKVPLDLIKPIWAAEIFEEWGLDEGEAKIIAHLRKKGYLFASVASRIERLENEIHVIHKVSPGQKVGIENIEFQDLSYFTPERLKAELGIEDNLPFISRMDGARLFELPLEIEFLYQIQGFPEAEVLLQFEWQGNNVKPIFYIDEGRQETVARLTFKGADLFSPPELLSRISSAPDGPFYQPTIQQDIEKLLNFYRNQGVRGTDIRAAVEMLEEDRFAVEFQIQEGKRVVIQEIVISGHQVTRLSTITRELRISRGELARYEAIRESKRRLESLGIFSEVRIEEIQLSPESMNLFIRLNEGQRNYLSAGLGLETATATESVDVWNEDVRLRGTGEVMRGNLFGTAAQLSLVGQLSIRERRAVASWQQPYFFRVPMKTYLSAWWEREERTSFQYERQGISLSGIRAFGGNRDWTLITGLRYARTKLLELEIEENEIDRQFFPYSTTSLEASVIRDRRDDPFNPTQGYFFSTALEWAYPLFDVESDFLKLFAKYQHYIPIRQDLWFSITSRLGLGSGRMPIPERFFAGGSNSFRGTRYDRLGPEDPLSGKPVGGKALFLVNFELVIPIFPQLQYLNAVLFYDKGNVFARRAEFSIRSLADAVGIGLRYRTPLGPVRLELGWNPGAPQGQSKTMVFITIGNIF